DEMQSLVLVSELAFVDQQSRVDFATEHGLLDLVEWDDDRSEIRLEKFEREIGTGHHTRDADALADNFFARHRVSRDQHRAVAVAHRCTVWKQRVAIGEVSVGVNGNRSYVELTTKRATIKRLDVLQLVDVVDSLRVDLSVSERIEHESVVRIGTVREMDGAGWGHVFMPRLCRACRIALVMSSWCLRYSSRFVANSA